MSETVGVCEGETGESKAKEGHPTSGSLSHLVYHDYETYQRCV